MVYTSKPFQVAVWLLLISLLILVGQNITFVFRPVVVLITTIFFPVLVAGILFYLTNPIVELLTSWRLPRTLAIIMVFVFFAALLLIALLYFVPILQQQLTALIANAPRFLAELDQRVAELQESTVFSQFEQFEFFRRWASIDYVTLLDGIIDEILGNLVSYIGSLANIAVILFTIPILLFYMLKDRQRFSEGVSELLPSRYRKNGQQVLQGMNQALSDYIQGLLIVSLFVGVFVYIGYRLIGLDYALLLSVFAMITNVIPYFGPFIGTIPGVIVGLIASPWVALQVVIMVLIVQQLESQLVAPVVIGRKLRIHPVTIIVILLTAGSLAGLLGVILAVPSFAVAKVVVTHIYQFVAQRQGGKGTSVL